MRIAKAFQGMTDDSKAMQLVIRYQGRLIRQHETAPAPPPPPEKLNVAERTQPCPNPATTTPATIIPNAISRQNTPPNLTPVTEYASPHLL